MYLIRNEFIFFRMKHIVAVVFLGLVCLLGKNEGKLNVKVNFSREKSVSCLWIYTFYLNWYSVLPHAVSYTCIKANKTIHHFNSSQTAIAFYHDGLSIKGRRNDKMHGVYGKWETHCTILDVYKEVNALSIYINNHSFSQQFDS